MKKSIYLSILHFNNTKATMDCLDSVRTIILADYTLTVLVVDNASEVPFALPKNAPNNWIVIRNGKNLGFSGGQNSGIRYALANGADYILILNNDTVVDEKFLEEMVLCAEKDKKIGVVTPKIYYNPGSEYHKTRYTKNEIGHVLWYAGGSIDWTTVAGKHRGVDEVDRGQYDIPGAISFASGCCMLIKKEVIEKVGMFDERYFLYYEDADFSERIKKAGFSLWYEPKALIWHKNAETSGGSGSDLQEYYVSRNRMLFGMIYGSIRLRFALLRESIRHIFHGRPWQKKGIIDFYKMKFGKGSYT